MKPQTSNQLKVSIERIVRPIVAAEDNKLLMRRELYSHAADAFEQEKARGATDEVATQKALERLGDHDVIRGELQAAVSWWSRVDYYVERLLRRPLGRSQIRHAAKIGGVLGLAITCSWLLIQCAPFLFGFTKCDNQQCTIQTLATAWPQLLRAALRLLPVFCLASFNAALPCIAIGELFSHGTNRQGFIWRLLQQTAILAFVICLQSAIITILSGFGLEWNAQSRRQFVNGLFGLSFLTAVTAIIAIPWVWLKGRKYRQLAEWLELDLT